jgi:hypothetical protein
MESLRELVGLKMGWRAAARNGAGDRDGQDGGLTRTGAGPEKSTNCGSTPNAVDRVVDHGEDGHRAGGDAQRLFEQLGRPERQAGGADGGGQRLEVDGRLAERRDQPELALGVLQEQVLAVAAGQGVADLPPLADPEDRRMLRRRVGDAVLVEEGEQVGAGRRHWRS